jgi:hypothetical protein
MPAGRPVSCGKPARGPQWPSSTQHALKSLSGLIARLVLGQLLVELMERAVPVAVEVQRSPCLSG